MSNYWKNKIKKYWTVNYVDDSFERISQFFRFLFLKRILLKLKLDHDKRIIDFGCWYCFFLDEIKKNWYKKLYWFDILKENIELCENNNFRNLIVWDIFYFYKKYSNKKFDFIYSITVLQHILKENEFEKVVITSNKLLNIGWYFYMIEWFWNDKLINKFILKRNKEKFIDLMKKNWFELIEDIQLINWWLYLINKFIRIRFLEKFLLKILFYLSIIINKKKKWNETLNSLLFKKIKNV